MREEVSSTALIISLMLHGLFLLLFLISWQQKVPTTTTETFTTRLVTLPSPKEVKRVKAPPRFVTTPDIDDTAPPPKTSLFSEKNVSVARETIKRGDGGGAANPPSAAPEEAPHASAPPVPPPTRARFEKPTSKAVPEKPSRPLDLALDRDTTLAKFGLAATTKRRPPKARPPSRTSPSQAGSQYRAFSRPSGSGAAFVGSSGVPDHLPNLPDGDITLLNTKAHQYAVFVRRVALRVFQALRRSGWDTLTARDIRSIERAAEIEVVLSQQGEIQTVTLLTDSGNQRFDTLVQEAARSGAADPNPPASAALADGTIRFFFRSRSWTRFGASRRTGAPREERWILLATGLR